MTFNWKPFIRSGKNNLIFCNIKEEDFAPLFSANGSRPNAPINSLVCAAILLNHNGWTIEELFTRIDFDLLTRAALGLTNTEEIPFCQATVKLPAYFLILLLFVFFITTH